MRARKKSIDIRANDFHNIFSINENANKKIGCIFIDNVLFISWRDKRSGIHGPRPYDDTHDLYRLFRDYQIITDRDLKKVNWVCFISVLEAQSIMKHFPLKQPVEQAELMHSGEANRNTILDVLSDSELPGVQVENSPPRVVVESPSSLSSCDRPMQRKSKSKSSSGCCRALGKGLGYFAYASVMLASAFSVAAKFVPGVAAASASVLAKVGIAGGFVTTAAALWPFAIGLAIVATVAFVAYKKGWFSGCCSCFRSSRSNPYSRVDGRDVDDEINNGSKTLQPV